MASPVSPPEWPKSVFAESLTRHSGILELMDDLGEAMTTGRGEMLMMGGGNPGHIPEMQALWRGRMAELLADTPAFDAMLADYDQPAGNPRFRAAVAGLLRREFGWPLGPENIAVTNGGQTAFFCLMNRFAGDFADGSHRRVLLPLVPEYIGYADQGVGRDLFSARRPAIERIGDREFKYHVDFENLAPGDDIAAIAVSRPTNPSSNVLPDAEIARLSAVARERGIPLLIDNAYGVPFPGVIFEEVTPVWDDHIILTLSLSKLGLPGTRTGIVVAREDIIRELSAINAIASLANNNVGQALTTPLMESGEILRLSRDVVRPFYRAKSEFAKTLLHEHLPAGAPWRVHRGEGAFFLWIWFENLPIPTRELYRRLKARKTLVIPGEYFFFGLDTADWPHSRECIRLSYTQSEDIVRRGIATLGEEVAKAYR
ncbi:MAG: valine--pyruvate transaminase [Verrucomicrobiae bacterium]|nr:valine--pyruvate transaminase [Verrucomicrobiae bacterium]